MPSWLPIILLYRWLSLEFEGIDCGDEVATWLSKFLKRPGVRLFYTTPKIVKKQTWEKMDAAQKMARTVSKRLSFFIFHFKAIGTVKLMKGKRGRVWLGP